VLSLLISITATGAHANAPFIQSGKGATVEADADAGYVPNRVLVQLKRTSASRVRMQSGTAARGALFGVASLDAISAQVGAIGAKPAIQMSQNISRASSLGLDRWVLIELAPGSNVEAAVAAYNMDPNVEASMPDYTFQPLVTPTDPLYAGHWGHNNTAQLRAFNYNSGQHTGAPVGTVGFDCNAEAGWSGPQPFGVPAVIIAIIDTGVNLSHPDLNVVEGYDFGDDDSNPEDDSAMAGHGTGCAGLAASKANNGMGACGSAPGCSIMPLKVSNSEGQFGVSAAANAIMWAADHGADVISMSFGLFTHGTIAIFDAAIDYADAAGVVMLSGTGNFNNALLYPASHAKVIGVGAASPCGGRKRSSVNAAFLAPNCSPDPNNVTCDNERWWGSNFGPDIQDAPNATDILAPTMLPTTDIQGAGGFSPGDYVPYFNGTSCSSPYAAGVVALIKSKHPDWTPAQIRHQLFTTAQDIVNVESVAGWDRYSGYGMVDIQAAVGCSANPEIVGKSSITVSPRANCCALIHPADLITSVTDPDGDEDIVSVRITKVDDASTDVDSALVCGLGVHSVQVTVSDYCGNTAGALVEVDVKDTTPPSLTVVMDHHTLWAPNHQMVPCCATIQVADNCGADPHVVLVSVVSSEGTNAKGSGDTAGDIAGADIGTDDRCFELRSERSGGGSGRYYTIVYSATDAASNVAYDTVQVRVPHDRSLATGDPAPGAARITALTSIHPNPFNPQTTVHFSLAKSARVQIAIYDVAGALVRQLVDENRPAGEHQALWNGTSDQGTGVTSGVYFVKMTAGSYSEVRKIVMLK
jgi:hypothetical protein